MIIGKSGLWRGEIPGSATNSSITYSLFPAPIPGCDVNVTDRNFPDHYFLTEITEAV